MNPAKSRRKKRQCTQHRAERYENALDKVIDGTANPEYAKQRWDKLKEVKG